MATAAIERTSVAVFRDYLRLAKPRTIPPHFMTAAAAMFLAAGGLPPLSTLLLTLAGGGLVAAAANTLNCYFDRELDGLMPRTRSRPLPAGRLAPRNALLFSLVTGLAGLVILGRFVSAAASLLAVGALAYYVLVYTLWLKRHSRWGALICSSIGAITPLIGWLAVTDRLTATPFLLAMIVIFWTLPHFWSLAIFRRNEYEQAGLKVLPAGGISAWILACSVLLTGTTFWLVPAADMGLLYLGTAGVLGGGLLYLAWPRSKNALSAAQRLYGYSILYITLLFGVIILDRII